MPDDKASKIEHLRARFTSRRAYYARCFTGEAGEYVLGDLFRLCKMGEPVFQTTDPIAAAFNDGARRVYLRILSILRRDPEEIVRRMIGQNVTAEED